MCLTTGVNVHSGLAPESLRTICSGDGSDRTNCRRREGLDFAKNGGTFFNNWKGKGDMDHIRFEQQFGGLGTLLKAIR